MSDKPLAYEPEVKAVQYTWENFPPDILQAMIDKTEHPDIKRHGRVDQFYLDISQQRIFDRVLAALDRAGVFFGDLKDRINLANPEGARELRILMKPDLDVAQITIKGHATHNGISCPQLETGPADSEKVKRVIEIEGFLNPRLVTGIIGKVWHDIRTRIGGEVRIVEHDILTSHNYAMIAETEINVVSEAEAVRAIAMMIAEGKLPKWFEEEVTRRDDMKNCQIAKAGIPDDIAAKMAAIDPRQRELTRRIAEAYGR